MDSDNANPNLSKYFNKINNPPSYFDELSKREESSSAMYSTSVGPGTRKTMIASATAPESASKSPLATSMAHENFMGSFQSTDYIENSDCEDTAGLPEEWYINWEDFSSESLTMPGLHTDKELADPIAIAAQKYLSESDVRERKVTSADEVTQDESGLRQLIARGCYRSATNLVARLLTTLGQGYRRAGHRSTHTPHSLQLWFTRLALLAKLGEFELLRAEAEPFGQLTNADVFYQHYREKYGDKEGSMACFSFRLLLAELPIYFGNPELAMNNLFKLYVSTHAMMLYLRQNGSGGADALWEKRELRVKHSLINCAILMKKFHIVSDMILQMFDNNRLSKEERRVLYSGWGRIYLQAGDIFGADQKFANARSLRDINSSPDIRDLIDKGLMTVAKNDFPEAFAIFQKALQLDSGNVMILNNMGVCLLYAGKMKDAIKLFERAIDLNPRKSLHESLLVNLATLYELESNSSQTKKLNLLRLINKHIPDLSISLELCLKLQTN